ncbi:MAG TPA: nucleotidyltransferase family protein [Clostridia bacterium]|nr:nucleotidyltransferase family protein [Clostridia bacterium]
MEREGLRPERQLVLMTAVEMDDSQAGRLKELLDEQLDWSDVIFQMLTHRTLNMFNYNLKKFGMSKVPEKEIQRLLESQWLVYGERNRCYLGYLSEVLKVLGKYNAVVPILKGNLLASLVYPAIEARIFNDLDLLMKLDDVNIVTKALEEAGFIQGFYDEEKQMVVEATRKAKVMTQMVSHELQEFQKVSDNPFAKLVQVDVNHDILWKGNCPYKIDTRDLIGRAVPIELNGAKGYMLDYVDNIIQLSCHLYKEATLMIWITDIRDLKIYKFADLFMYIKKFYGDIDWNLLVSRVKGYNIDKIVYYNFHYIEMMFGELIPQEVMASLRPEDLTYLDEYGVENREPSVWKVDFFTRLFDTNRVLSVEGETTGMSRFMDAKMKADGKCFHRTIQGIV